VGEVTGLDEGLEAACSDPECAYRFIIYAHPGYFNSVTCSLCGKPAYVKTRGFDVSRTVFIDVVPEPPRGYRIPGYIAQMHLSRGVVVAPWTPRFTIDA